MTFGEYLAETGNLKGCIILSEYVWNPKNEDTPFYDFSYGLLCEIFEDYKKEYDETKNVVEGILEIVYISRIIEKQVEAEGRKEREKRKANTSLYEC